MNKYIIIGDASKHTVAQKEMLERIALTGGFILVDSVEDIPALEPHLNMNDLVKEFTMCEAPTAFFREKGPSYTCHGKYKNR